jgi:hypothetical protein
VTDGRVRDSAHRAPRSTLCTGRLHHKSESYWIVLPGVRPGGAASCAGWSAPALRLFFISKLTPPCFFPIEKGSQGPTDASPTHRSRRASVIRS